MSRALLQSTLTGPDVWSGADLRNSTSWLTTYTNDELAELDAAIQQFANVKNPLEISRADFSLPLLERKFAAARKQLEGGRGFQVFRGLPVDNYTLEENKRLFWMLSQLVGEPEGQDREGNRMHSVTDTGQKVEENSSVRGYQTDEELTFHNDGGDAFMLICLKTAVSGGVSKLISVSHAFNQVLKHSARLAAVLQEPFYFDARDQHPGGLKVQGVPIFNYYQGKLSALYKRHYIETAQRFPEVPRLTSEQIEAMDMLDSICNDPDHQLSFTMQRGDIQIGNNYSILHSRTRYQDHDDPKEKRHLLRTWLTLPNGRALPPVFSDTREFAQSFERRLAA